LFLAVRAGIAWPPALMVMVVAYSHWPGLMLGVSAETITGAATSRDRTQAFNFLMVFLLLVFAA
jgi:hypothetical protein